MLRRLRRRAAAAIIAVAISAAGLIGASAWSDQWVRHSRDVSRLAREVLAAAIDRQTLLRGLALTGDTAYLARERVATATLERDADSLRALIRDDAEQASRMRTLDEAIGRWDREYVQRATARAREGAGRDITSLPELAAFDRVRFGDVRRAAAALLDAEEARYGRRVLRTDQVRWALLGTILGELVLLGATFGRLARRTEEQVDRLEEQQQQLEEQATELEEQAVELEHQLDEARVLTEELETANAKLRAEADARTRAEMVAGAARRERELSDSLLAHVLDSAPIGIAIHDREGRFVRVNQVVASLSGHAPAEYVGRTYAQVDPERAALFDPIVDRVLRQGEVASQVEFEIAPGTRTERNWLASVYPVRDGAGEIIGCCGLLVETTEHRRLQRQFEQAQKMEAVGRLAGGVAHDFNNLLTAITSYSDLVLETLPPDDGRRVDVREIRAAADRAAALTRQLLTFSRQQIVHPQRLVMSDVVDGVERMLRRLLPEDIELRVARAADERPVLADPGQVEQVLVNLCVNARDAMPKGGTIAIATSNVSVGREELHHREGTPVAPGEYVMLSITDTGVGMDRETLANVFEPFFTTKEVGRGTGLGLATVYGIVRQAGGAIWAYSEPGRGTTFKLFWPASQGALDPVATAPVAEPVAIPGATILIVEDEPSVREVVRRLLLHQGHRVVAARNGKEALEILADANTEIDLVITDMVMPEMSGVELVARLRERRDRVRVIYMSGYNRESLTGAHRRAMEDAYLEKPFSAVALARKVREVLGTRTPERVGGGATV